MCIIMAHRLAFSFLEALVKIKDAPMAQKRGDPLLLSLEKPLRMLTADHIMRIDEALIRIGTFGEVRLIKDDGRLRYILTLRSKDILK